VQAALQNIDYKEFVDKIFGVIGLGCFRAVSGLIGKMSGWDDACFGRPVFSSIFEVYFYCSELKGINMS
jgi:hypothetical protein